MYVLSQALDRGHSRVIRQGNVKHKSEEHITYELCHVYSPIHISPVYSLKMLAEDAEAGAEDEKEVEELKKQKKFCLHVTYNLDSKL